MKLRDLPVRVVRLLGPEPVGTPAKLNRQQRYYQRNKDKWRVYADRKAVANSEREA